MQTYRLTLAYDGTRYCGWQRQIGERTIQGELETALHEVTGRPAQTLAAGRTDAGVHALGQVVAARLETALPAEVIARACNAKLPHDIAVLDAARVEPSFHPIRDALRKRYRYILCDAAIRDVFRRHYSWHFVGGPLNAEAMARAAATLRGTHDFRSFATSGSPRKTTVRTVFDCTVRRSRAGEWPLPAVTISAATDSTAREDWIVVEVEADGFLYNMVRTIVGTLVEVGRGAKSESWPSRVLQAADRTRAGRTAPPQGLFLLRVTYTGGWESGHPSEDDLGDSVSADLNAASPLDRTASPQPLSAEKEPPAPKRPD